MITTDQDHHRLQDKILQRINKIEHKEKSHKNTNFELNMYHPTETANAITPISWFYQLYVHTPHQKLDACSSRLEILFLLDTGASISVLNFTNIQQY